MPGEDSRLKRERGTEDDKDGKQRKWIKMDRNEEKEKKKDDKYEKNRKWMKIDRNEEKRERRKRR